jgi:hypothetical protein
LTAKRKDRRFPASKITSEQEYGRCARNVRALLHRLGGGFKITCWVGGAIIALKSAFFRAAHVRTGAPANHGFQISCGAGNSRVRAPASPHESSRSLARPCTARAGGLREPGLGTQSRIFAGKPGVTDSAANGALAQPGSAPVLSSFCCSDFRHCELSRIANLLLTWVKLQGAIIVGDGLRVVALPV